MLPWELIERVPVSSGSKSELCLYKRGDEFSIRLDRCELMNSRVHGSEEALAELALTKVAKGPESHVLIGGLGMGYTTAAALRQLNDQGQIVIAELVPAVVRWNRGPLAHLAGHPLDDPRVIVLELDITEILKTERRSYDVILLDVDNGPAGLTQKSNNWLYTEAGLYAASTALRPKGVLGVWSATPDKAFHRRMFDAGFEVEEVQVRSRGSRGGSRHTIWLGNVKR